MNSQEKLLNHATVDSNKNTLAESELNDFVKSLAPMMESIAALQKQAEALGLFPNHRDLVECDDCQLFEDVTYEGILYVYRDRNFNQDTGLRFKELDENAMQCPECNKLFCGFDAKLFDSL